MTGNLLVKKATMETSCVSNELCCLLEEKDDDEQIVDSCIEHVRSRLAILSSYRVVALESIQVHKKAFWRL